MALLEIKNLSFTYPNASEKALDGVNLTVEKGEFAVIFGESGCGKSTLLKLLKKQISPVGTAEGELLYKGKPIASMDERQAASEIGYVMQNPENQIVTDKVWHELAFGLESLGLKPDEIRRKVAEICGFFGIGEWYHKKTNELSGGQKQLLNLASVTVMHPEVLLLDEPTSQLDPIAASDFIGTLKKINEELGVTVLLVEHRLEDVFPIAHKAIFMERGTVTAADTPRAVGETFSQRFPDHKMALALPSAVRIYNQLKKRGLAGSSPCPLTVREGKRFLEDRFDSRFRGFTVTDEDFSKRAKAIEVKEGFFRYERKLPDILKGLDLTVYQNEIFCILGGNGAGKTTLLKVLSGLKRLYRGKIRIDGKPLKEYGEDAKSKPRIACLPQNPQLLFCRNTVREDLEELTGTLGWTKEQADREIDSLCQTFGICRILPCHPFDLSGGEQQKAAMVKLLLTHPSVILLDEPTKGIDAASKQVLANLLLELQKEGKTVVIVTHDIEFAAEYADRCAMLFDGQIVSVANPVEFFASNSFYTTAASRISRGLYRNAVTAELVTQICEKNGLKR